ARSGEIQLQATHTPRAFGKLPDPVQRISSFSLISFYRLVMTKQSLFRTQDGVSFTRRAADKCDAGKNVTAIGWARARDGTGWQLVLSFSDRDGRTHEVL